MAVFKVFMINISEPLEVDLPAASIQDLAEVASRTRFICGRVIEADGEGPAPAAMLPTNRIQFVVEL